jgi:NAD(P)-dependent dehydrogenase (short-subunit alcohol dehydrogenase family)
MATLIGKAIVVCGGARGIGAAVSEHLVRQGARVLVVDAGVSVDGRQPDPTVVENWAGALRGQGSEIRVSAADLTAPDAAATTIELAKREFGALDGVVYAAGIQRDATFLRANLADLRATADTNLFGAFAVMQAAAQTMVDAKTPGSMVLMTAPGAVLGMHRQADVAVASAGVIALMRTAALELRRYGIRVNAVAPTAKTRANEALPMFTAVRSTSLLAEHVAPVVAHLLSDRSVNVTGEVIGVAGGRIYAVGTRDTAGITVDPPVDDDTLANRWAEIIRG